MHVKTYYYTITHTYYNFIIVKHIIMSLKVNTSKATTQFVQNALNIGDKIDVVDISGNLVGQISCYVAIMFNVFSTMCVSKFTLSATRRVFQLTEWFDTECTIDSVYNSSHRETMSRGHCFVRILQKMVNLSTINGYLECSAIEIQPFVVFMVACNYFEFDVDVYDYFVDQLSAYNVTNTWQLYSDLQNLDIDISTSHYYTSFYNKLVEILQTKSLNINDIYMPVFVTQKTRNFLIAHVLKYKYSSHYIDNDSHLCEMLCEKIVAISNSDYKISLKCVYELLKMIEWFYVSATAKDAAIKVLSQTFADFTVPKRISANIRDRLVNGNCKPNFTDVKYYSFNLNFNFIPRNENYPVIICEMGKSVCKKLYTTTLTPQLVEFNISACKSSITFKPRLISTQLNFSVSIHEYRGSESNSPIIITNWNWTYTKRDVVFKLHIPSAKIPTQSCEYMIVVHRLVYTEKALLSRKRAQDIEFDSDSDF